MDRVTSEFSGVALTAVGLAAMLAIFMPIVYIIYDMRESLTSMVAESSTQNIGVDLKELSVGKTQNIMPSATAYALIIKNAKFIEYEANTLDAQLRVVDNEDSVLKNNLKGLVRLEVKEVAQGNYIVYVYPQTVSGVDRVVTLQGVNNLKVKYGG